MRGGRGLAGSGRGTPGAVTLAAASSGRFGTLVPSARPRRRHDLPGQCPRARDHDQLPSRGADGERSRVSSLKNAQDIGDLFADTWAGPALADHDPLAHIGGCKPTFTSVA